jgi:hypothetical protein
MKANTRSEDNMKENKCMEDFPSGT